MNRTERQTRISEQIVRRGEVSVDDLAEVFDVSHETIRRDLHALAESGEILRVHGGARVPVALGEDSFSTRQQKNAAAKHRIGEKAMAFVEPGDAIFIDTGSTTLACAEALAEIAGLNVVTNSSRIAAVFSQTDRAANVILLGGHFRSGNDQTVGPMTLESIASFRARTAFITVGGIDAEAGLTDYDFDEAVIARAMMAHASRSVVVADAAKFGRTVPFRVAGLEAVQALICERPPEGRLADKLEDLAIDVV